MPAGKAKRPPDFILGRINMSTTRRNVIAGAVAGAGAMLARPYLALAQTNLVRVGLIPSEDSRAMLESSKQLLEALEKNLGIKVQGFVAADYNGVIEAMRANHIEVAYLGPFSYVLGTTIAPIEAFATAETAKSGRTFYHSQIIARKDSGLKDIKDLKGRTVAFVDPSSTSGHLFPKAGLIKMGINPDTYFGRVMFTGSHDANALAVANKRVDAATIADRIFDAAVQKKLVNADEIEVLWRSDPIPESPTCWRKNLPEDLKARIKSAFLNIRDITWADQGKLNRFVETNDAAYDVIRETAKALNLDLKKMK
jgi:phosphonate transport system substrate-binding protein